MGLMLEGCGREGQEKEGWVWEMVGVKYLQGGKKRACGRFTSCHLKIRRGTRVYVAGHRALGRGGRVEYKGQSGRRTPP